MYLNRTQRRPRGKQKRRPDSGVSHLTRAKVPSGCPQHIVCKLLKGLPRLRSKRTHRVLAEAFTKGKERFGFRLIHYSVQNDHLHFVTEATSKEALTRGMQGLSIRIAKALNRLWGRKGKVFADRYFSRVLRKPREVRNVLIYVLQNYLHHTAERWTQPLDFFSSAPFLVDGWREIDGVLNPPPELPVADPRCWLLTKGWRRHGLLSVTEAPAH